MRIHECFPYLRVHDAKVAIAFYLHVFGGHERFRLVDPSDGRIGHAEIELSPKIVLMVSDEYPEFGIFAPKVGSPSGIGLHLHVDDCDELLARAVAAGAELTMPAQNQFYGERSGKIRDPFGHEWMIGHSIEAVDPVEMQRRWNAGEM